MIALRNSLADDFHDRLEFPGGASDTSLDKFHLGRDDLLHFRHSGLVFGDVPDRMRGVGMFTYQVVFTCYRLKYHNEVLRKVGFGHK